jgi:hypothetical protein
MKKLSLKDMKNGLSRKEMKNVGGGFSWLYCQVNAARGLEYFLCREYDIVPQ